MCRTTGFFVTMSCVETKVPKQKNRNSPVWSQLQQAIKANDAPQAEKLLQQWLRARWPEREHYNIDDLPLSDESKAACKALSKAVFGNDPISWQGNTLLKALQQDQITDPALNKKAPQNKGADLIPQLNP